MAYKTGNKIVVRTIKTVFYYGKQVVKTNKASHANRAVLHCVNHMQLNTYEATHAEVYDEETGVLHAVIRRTIKGIAILYKREVREEY
mgnify:CR=1 FL=1